MYMYPSYYNELHSTHMDMGGLYSFNTKNTPGKDPDHLSNDSHQKTKKQIGSESYILYF